MSTCHKARSKKVFACSLSRLLGPSCLLCSLVVVVCALANLQLSTPGLGLQYVCCMLHATNCKLHIIRTYEPQGVQMRFLIPFLLCVPDVYLL